jgi:hypothetical protein
LNNKIYLNRIIHNQLSLRAIAFSNGMAIPYLPITDEIASADGISLAMTREKQSVKIAPY